ncbi:hypothetical protein AAG906_040287 [Vitis piasezkii]
MVRNPCYDKYGRKKGAWSPEEDEKLRAYVQRYGHWNWRELPRFAGLSRCGKSCRLRWLNYLRPNVKRGNYSKAEEETIKKLHAELGNKWSAIAKKLPGRTDNEIKNYWHTHLKKRERQNPAKSQVVQQPPGTSKREGDDQKRKLESENIHADAPSHYILESFSTSPESESSSSEISTLSFDYTPAVNEMNWFADEGIASSETFAEPNENFWTEPFLTEDSYTQYYYPPINASLYDSYCDNDTDLFPDIWSIS